MFIVIVVFLSYGRFVGTKTTVGLLFLFWLEIRRMLCPCFDQMCLFLAPLHHCFICLLKHIATILQREKVYSLEFTTTNVRRGTRSSFWEGKDLITMTIAHFGRDVPSVRNSVLPYSQVLSAVSLEPTIICCSGGSADFIKTLDKAPCHKSGI